MRLLSKLPMVEKWLPACALALFGWVGLVSAESNPWHFTAEQIEVAYRYQRNYGQRLRNFVKPHECFYGQTDFIAEFQGKRFPAPCHFIYHTTRHLKTMLQQGMVKYLFSLDAGHGHLLIPNELWELKYRNLSFDEILPLVLRETGIAVLYHGAEHLIVDNETNFSKPELTNWKSQRNVLAFYDGREPKVLPPHADGSGHERVEGYQTVLSFHFLAHKLGELIVSASGISHSFDLAFEDDLGEQAAPPQMPSTKE